MFDDDCSFLKEHVRQIYKDWSAPNWLKHTEFVFPQRLKFKASDILRIVVRSEAEKLVLLTLLTEHDAPFSAISSLTRRLTHNAILTGLSLTRSFSIHGSMVQTSPASAQRDVMHNQYHLGLQPAVAPAT
ncbi:MAG: hypothetical protein ACLSH6_08095 [Limosilactobacillus pontis]